MMNSLFATDCYKTFHVHSYKPGITHVYSNFTNRAGRYSNTRMDKVVFVGLQAYIKQYLIGEWSEFFRKPKEEAVREYKRVVEGFLNRPIDATHIEKLHELGYLPLEIKALPEGSLVPYGVPCLTIVNTVENFGWLTNYIETSLSAELWGISTSATTAYAYRKRFEESSLPKSLIPYLGHDFSYRGMWGTHAAAMSGFGHLCSFKGSDTIPAGLFAEKHYGAEFGKDEVMSSVRATEHSTATSYGEEGELDCLRHHLQDVAPDGILSMVMDGYDFWKVITEYLPQLKDIIMSRNGTLTCRPDSGDPVDVLCGSYFPHCTPVEAETFENFKRDAMEILHEDFTSELSAFPAEPFDNLVRHFAWNNRCFYVNYEPTLNIAYDRYYYVDNSWNDESKYTFKEIERTPEHKGLIECLWEIFGGTIDEATGLKVLDSHIGAIYGDSITLERQNAIINKLEAKGFMPTVVLGIGSYTYQFVTRDTHGSAVKATDIQFGAGNHQPIFKEPKTDLSKRSARGLLRVDEVDGTFVLTSDVTPAEEQGGALQTVFKDGVLLKETTLMEIRQKIDATFA